MTTKKNRILALHAQGKTTREIAKAVYGVPDSAPGKVADRKMAYVRVVTKARKNAGRSETDRRYMDSGGRKKARDRQRHLYQTNDAWRQLYREKQNEWKRADYARRKALDESHA